MPSVKLSITVRKALERKYSAKALTTIDKAVKAWIAADAKRGIKTVHVAVDDAEKMKALGVPAVKGVATANKIKKAVDALWTRLTPDYLVILGGHDVVPFFVVANPSFDPAGDDDESVPTDNPYASSRPFLASKRTSFLIPDRVVGRIPDMLEDADPSWFTDYLATATAWVPTPSSDYKNVYAICCDEWKGSGKACVEYIASPAKTMLVAPPQKDSSATARKRLSSLVHMIKCHGSALDPQFYGQKGEAYPVALFSATLRPRLKPRTLVGAMCCYGAQVYSPDDPAGTMPGEWPLASAYLRGGSPAFAGATMIAWVGADQMLCADWIVAGYLKGSLGGASVGRALLEAKQDYVRWINQQGQAPDVADEKTLIEFVLLGDPSLHPVKAAATNAPRLAKATAAAAGSPLLSQERRQRRVARAQMANQIREILPSREPAGAAAVARAAQVFKAVQAELTGSVSAFPIKPKAARVEKVETQLPAAPVAAGRRRAPANRANRQSIEYYWSGRLVKDGHKLVRLIKAETDTQGNLIRTVVLHSS